MSLKDFVKVVPQSEAAKQKLAWYMNNNPYARIENKREDGRIFLSSQSQPDFWFWVVISEVIMLLIILLPRNCGYRYRDHLHRFSASST